MYPLAARLNHDCAPNTHYYIDPETFTHHVHAVRQVSAGEELTIGHVSPLQPTASRQQILSESFSFTCSCKRCLDAEDSDAALAESMDSQKLLSACINDPSTCSKFSIASATQRSLALYESQGLHESLDSLNSYAANAATALGDTEAGRRYANLTAQALALSKGSASAQARVWKDMAESG